MEVNKLMSHAENQYIERKWAKYWHAPSKKQEILALTVEICALKEWFANTEGVNQCAIVRKEHLEEESQRAMKHNQSN